jgi:hypothetical protein
MFPLTIRRLTLALTLAAFAAAAFFHPLKPAYACSCIAPPPPLEARDEAQSVFSGTVSAIGPEANGFLVTFDVEQLWKGPDGPQLTVSTPSSSASCGVEFVEGEQYLVYGGFADDGRLSTNLCTRTAPLASAGDDLAALGAGATPDGEPTAPQTEVSTGLPWLPFALGGAGLAVIALAAVLLRRRRAA